MNMHGEFCGCAAGAAEDILKSAFRLDVAKALDPLDPDDYLKILAKLERSMSRATRETEKKILNKALNSLDVDWTKLNSKQRRAIIGAANKTLLEVPKKVVPVVTQQLEVAGPTMMTDTRIATKAALPARFGAKIQTSLALRDERILTHSIKSQALFVTDQYKQRRENFSRRARSVVQEGLADGLGRDDITQNLQKALGSAHGLGRSESYFNVIASAFMNRSRTYAQLAGYQEAGIQYEIFEAILDEATTDQCRFLHGKRFKVSDGLKRYEQTEEASDPEAVKDIMPWIQVGKSEKGEQVLYTKDREGNRTLIAQIAESGVGSKDKIGTYTNAMNESQLSEIGAFMPPLHGRCRSTIVADV